LFGLIEVPMWDYWWGLTESQIDLLLVDQPLISYKHEKKKGKNGKFDTPPAPSKLKVAEAELKWRQKYADGSKPKLNLNIGDFSMGAVNN